MMNFKNPKLKHQLQRIPEKRIKTWMKTCKKKHVRNNKTEEEDINDGNEEDDGRTARLGFTTSSALVHAPVVNMDSIDKDESVDKDDSVDKDGKGDDKDGKEDDKEDKN